MLDKKTQRWTDPAIASALQRSGYFPPAIEKRLSDEIESPGNRALRLLRDGKSIGAKDRRALAVYMATMLMRVEGRRRKTLDLVPGTLKRTTSRLRRDLSSRLSESKPERLKELMDEIDRLEAAYAIDLPPHLKNDIFDPFPSKTIVGVIERMVWRFIPCPGGGSPYVTSDNPAFFFTESGIGPQGAEITFPISSKLALVASHQGKPGTSIWFDIERIPALIARRLNREINRRLAVGAERFIISSQRADWITTLAGRSNRDLSQFNWQNVRGLSIPGNH